MLIAPQVLLAIMLNFPTYALSISTFHTPSTALFFCLLWTIPSP